LAVWSCDVMSSAFARAVSDAAQNGVFGLKSEGRSTVMRFSVRVRERRSGWITPTTAYHGNLQ